MIPIAIGKVVWNQSFLQVLEWDRDRDQFSVRNNNLYVPPRLLPNVILSQVMCHKYFSKTLEKSLSRDSQSAFRDLERDQVLFLSGAEIELG
jgi:hypothetical protein